MPSKTSSYNYRTRDLQDLTQKGMRPLALGEKFPNSPHSIFCSLPKLKDVILYEEKEEKICKKIQGGYPRFFYPKFTQKLEQWLTKQYAKEGHMTRLLSSEQAAESLLRYLTTEARVKIHTHDHLTFVSFPIENLLQDKIQKFLQHTGCMVFSRQAEDCLVALGELTQIYTENMEHSVALKGTDSSSALVRSKGLVPVRKQAKIRQDGVDALYASLSEDFQTSKQNLFLSRCGMNALFAVHQAISRTQYEKGPIVWIQLGWLYLDTMEILKKFAKQEQDYIYLSNVLDLQALEELLASLENRNVVVVTEAPTNPLLLTPDIQCLFGICQKAKSSLVLDTSLSGTSNLNVLSHCDVVVCSLTKYHGWSGDLIMGLAVLNPQSRYYHSLLEAMPSYIDPPYYRDKQRLSYLMQDYRRVLSKINQNTMQLAAYLQRHPRIKKLHWAYGEATGENYTSIAKDRRTDLPGSVISFELDMPLQDFYDKIALPKGPSFGTAFSLLCPFLYLAHYDLVKTKEGCSYLQSNNINPELLRFSVGIEPIDDLYSVFEKALQ